jgi:hypothetical protein
MWVLSPILSKSAASQRPSDSAPAAGAAATAAAAAAAAAAATPNVNHYLVAGPLRVGRAGAGGGADVEVHGDMSVSARHAAIALEPAAEGGGTVVLLTGEGVRRAGRSAAGRWREHVSPSWCSSAIHAAKPAP